LPDLISSALTDVDSGFANHHWRDLDGAIAAAAERILSRIVQQKDGTLEIFRGVFYRGRGAYLVGRITAGARRSQWRFVCVIRMKAGSLWTRS
jgi:isocitrate dehydrogenase kinase/phosphatase